MNRISLKYRIAITIFLLEATMVGLVLWRTQTLSYSEIDKQNEAYEHVLIDLLSENSRYALITGEYGELQPLINKALANQHVIRIFLADYRNRVVASSHAALLGKESPPLVNQAHRRWRRHEIANPAGYLGSLAIEFSNAPLIHIYRRARIQGIALAIISMTLIALVGILTGFLLTRRLETLAQAAQMVAEGDFNTKIDMPGTDEVANLAKHFDNMVDKISAIIDSLRDREEELKESEERFRHFFEQANIGLALTSPQKRWLRINRHLCQMLGYSEEELYETTWAELTYPDDLETDIEQFKRVLSGEIEEYALDKRFVGKNDDLINTHLTVSCIRNFDGSVKFLIATLEDITKQLQLQEQLFQAHKMEAIGTLAGGIAHDFNNILSAVIGYTELVLMDMQDNERSTLNLKQVLNAANRARDLVRQILAFSRKGEHQKKPISPHLLIKESLKLLRSSLPASIAIQEDIDPESGALLADPTNIQQVIMNLCTNALHAMENEHGTLTVKLARKVLSAREVQGEVGVSPGPFIELTVSDTGHGMDQSTLKRIFEPYFTTKELDRGTGMGLAVVHGIIQDAGGMITVASEVGKGTTFRVCFPAVDEALAETLEEENKPLPCGNERILVVDDENPIARFHKISLECLGYTVTEKTSSTEALEAFRSDPNRFDLIITDQTMPGMTGVEIAKEMLTIRSDVPIILFTGYSSMISEESVKEMGIKEFVLKPVDREELAKVVRRALDNA